MLFSLFLSLAFLFDFLHTRCIAKKSLYRFCRVQKKHSSIAVSLLTGFGIFCGMNLRICVSSIYSAFNFGKYREGITAQNSFSIAQQNALIIGYIYTMLFFFSLILFDVAIDGRHLSQPNDYRMFNAVPNVQYCAHNGGVYDF